MDIQPLNSDIVALWNDPDELIAQWASGEHKLKVEHEQLVADWVGVAHGLVADLGCGVGRLVRALNPSVDDYFGFDGSSAMVMQARRAHPGYTFSVVDVFSYSSDRDYDVAVMLDVAQHQDKPLGSLSQIMQLWSARRYVMSLLVGDAREELSMSVVASLSGLLHILDQVTLNRMHMERCGIEGFAWVLLDLSRQ